MLTASELIGSRVMEYDVIRVIGAGGMGIVYEGCHPIIGKRVAIKVLLPQYAEDQGLVTRFVDEARSVNAIRHRGIIDIFGFGALEGGGQYICMELLEGASFADLLRQRKCMTWSDLLPMADEVLDALEAAHSAGIIHRDLKPSNLFLVDTGRGQPYVKVLDFGVAKLLGSREARLQQTGIIGTPEYMAPEQILLQPVGGYTDVYALGVVLYQLLTGRRPFNAAFAPDLMRMHVTAQRPLPSSTGISLPAALDVLIQQMMAIEPGRRPSVAEARRVIAQLRRKPPSLVPKAPVPQTGPSDTVLMDDDEPQPATHGERGGSTEAPSDPGRRPLATPMHPITAPSMEPIAPRRPFDSRTRVWRPTRAPMLWMVAAGVLLMALGGLGAVWFNSSSSARDPRTEQTQRFGQDAVVGSAEAKAAEAKAAEAKAAEAKAAEAKAAEAKAAEAKAAEAKAAEAKAAEAKAADAKAAEAKAAEAKAAEAKAAEAKAAEAKAAEAKAAEAKAAEAKAAEAKAAEAKAAEAKAAEARRQPVAATGGTSSTASKSVARADPNSMEKLLARLSRAQVQLKKYEAARGGPDEVLRRLVESVRSSLQGQPDAPERAAVARQLSDIEAQLK